MTLLFPAAGKCIPLAQQLGLDPVLLGIIEKHPFDIMLEQLVYNKQITPQQLHDALKSPFVGDIPLAKKVLQHDFGEYTIVVVNFIHTL